MNINFDFEKDHTSNNRNNDMQKHLGSQDEVINKTGWKPLVRGGQSFKSHAMVRVGDERLVFKQSFAAKFWYGLIIFVGLLMLGLFIFKENPSFIGVLLGLLFMGIGFYFYRNSASTVTLDRSLHAMWKGDVDPKSTLNKSSIEDYRSLKGLHAVQVIQEFMRGEHDSEGQKEKSYYSYEINLVFANGNRKSVLDHGHKKSIDSQALAIAELFDVPLWDGCRNDEMGLFEHFTRLKGWASWVLIFVFLGLFINQFYGTITQRVQEDNHLKQLSPEEREQMKETSSHALIKGVKDANFSSYSIKSLLKRGADIDRKDTLGRTPLFYAVQHKNINQIQALLHKRADINVTDNEGTELISLLDPVEDQFLYYTLADAALRQEALSRGIIIDTIERNIDPSGKVISLKITER